MFKSILKGPNEATTIGLAQGALIIGIYSGSLPNLADVRAAAPHDSSVESSRKGSAITSAVLLGTVFMFTKDVQAFIIGGAALVGIDYLYKHMNATHPATGKLDATGDAESMSPGLALAAPLPSYSEDDTGLDYGN